MASSTADQALKPISSSKDLPPLEELIGRNFVSMKQLAALCGVTYRTARAWCMSDPPKVAAVRVGGQFRIYEDELRRFLEEGNMKAGSAGNHLG